MSEKNPLRGVKWFYVAWFALLILVLTFIGIMGWLGYEMIDTAVKFILFGLLAGSAMIAGALWAVRRIWRRWLKVTVGAALTLVILFVFMGMYMAFTIILFTQTELQYTTLTSDGGASAAVMRIADAEDMISSPAEEEGLRVDYRYTAYPRKLHFFYDADCPSEGELVINSGSAAQLMYEWTADDTLHMYIENPEPGDGGELTLVIPE